jgi:unsaturated rhamnogalacturonyl hydrolase
MEAMSDESLCKLAHQIEAVGIIQEFGYEKDRQDQIPHVQGRDIPEILYYDPDTVPDGNIGEAYYLQQPIFYHDFERALMKAGVPMPSTNESKTWSILAANSLMQRSPLLSVRWHYEPGVALMALKQIWEKTGDASYFEFIRANMDTFVKPGGVIKTYKLEEYNLDQINQGKLLFWLYERTRDEKYYDAAKMLAKQLETHPRIAEYGFWHKKIYPHQMWLDGIYMAAPFNAEYGMVFNEPERFDDVYHQITLIEKHTRDPETGLLYHAWDQKRAQIWANPKTGYSPNFWGRAMGWFLMALVDILEILPDPYPNREKIIEILDRSVAAVIKVQDPNSGVWYQVLDQGSRAGNYLEASASCMFVYAMAKGVRKGYLDEKYFPSAKRGYDGIIQSFITLDEMNLVNLNSICSVAGLSHDRDGSFEYYVSEEVVSNDYKGFGPFIMASVEMERFE